VPLASKKVSDQAFEWFNPPANVYNHLRKYSNEAGEQLVPWNARNLCQYQPFVDDVTGLIIGAEHNSQTTLSGVPAMVMACVKPIAINYAVFVHPFAMNAVKTAQIHCWWYEQIPMIDPAQRNSDPPHAYISVIKELSQQVFSSLTLCIRLSQRLLAPVLQWYTAERPQSTQFTDFKHSCLQRSGKCQPGYWPRTGL